jgi:hypothetical protein
MPAIARLQLTAIGRPDPEALAAYSAAITGWPVGDRDHDWVELDAGGGVFLDPAGHPLCLVTTSG